MFSFAVWGVGSFLHMEKEETSGSIWKLHIGMV